MPFPPYYGGVAMCTVQLTWAADGTLCRYKVVPAPDSVPDVDCDYRRVPLPSGALPSVPTNVPSVESSDSEAQATLPFGVDPYGVYLWRKDYMRRLERRRVEAVRRLRRAIRLTGSSMVMVTLTVGGRRCYSRSDILDLFSEFVSDVLRKHSYFADVRIVAVPEPHLSGEGDAVHVPWHIHFVYPATRRMPHAVLLWLRSAWTQFLVASGYPVSEGAQYHRIHVTPPRRLAGVVKYLAGYLGKSFSFDGVGLVESPSDGSPCTGRVHRYYVSRNSLVRVRISLEDFLMLRAAAGLVWDYWRSYTAQSEGDPSGLVSGWLYFEGFT